MPRNNRPIIIGAALLGILALGLTMMMLLRPAGGGSAGPGGEAAAPVAPTTTQLVAARDIPPRTVITPTMVAQEETSSPDPAALKNVGELQAGRITTRAIRRGEPITGNAMINSIARVVPANFAVREGLRAVAIWVDPNQTAAGLVDVGDRVDVISTHKLSTAKQSTELYDQIVVGSTDFSSARTIAQDLEVLAVDKSITAASAPAPAAAAPGAPGAAPPPPPPPPPPANANQTARTRVVVATSPAVAATLVAANETGNLHITIRNPNSRERFPVAETRQYPSRVVNVPKPSAFRGRGGGGGNAGGGGGGDRGRRPPVDRIPYGPLPMDPSPGSGAAGVGTALPTGSMGGTPIPPPPSGSEVTVIRGTEKTRVIVPSR